MSSSPSSLLLSSFFHPVVVNAVVTRLTFLQISLRRKRQLDHRGATHMSQSHLPGSVSVRGFPNTLIQVNHTYQSHTKHKCKHSQSELKPNKRVAVTGLCCLCCFSSVLVMLDVLTQRLDLPEQQRCRQKEPRKNFCFSTEVGI